MTTCNDGVRDCRPGQDRSPCRFLRSFGAYAGETEIPQAGTTNYGPITLKWDVFAAETCLLLEQKMFEATDTFTFTPNKLSYVFTFAAASSERRSFSNASVQFAVMPAVVSVTAKPNKGPRPTIPPFWPSVAQNAGHCNISVELWFGRLRWAAT